MTETLSSLIPNVPVELALESLILACLLMLFRVAAFIMFLPPFNGQGLPNTVKVGLSLALVVVLAPRYAPQIALVLDHPKSPDAVWLQLAYLGVRETALGGAGLVVRPLSGSRANRRRLGSSGNGADDGRTDIADGPAGEQRDFAGSGSRGRFAVLCSRRSSRDVHGTWTVVRDSTGREHWGMPSWDTVMWSVSMSVDQGFLVIAPIGILLFVVSLTLLITMRVAPQFNFMSWGMALRLIAGIGSLVMFFPEICGAVQHMLSYVGREVLMS